MTYFVGCKLLSITVKVNLGEGDVEAARNAWLS